MTGRTTVSVDNSVKGRLDDQQRDGESLSDTIARALDALDGQEPQDGCGECTLNAPMEEYVDEIVARTKQETADEVQNRLRTR
jgi:hypothetical protein